jgi:hypothetical protein
VVVSELRSAEPSNRFVALSALTSGSCVGWDNTHLFSAPSTPPTDAQPASDAAPTDLSSSADAAPTSFTALLQATSSGVGSGCGAAGGVALRYSPYTLQSSAVATALIQALCAMVSGDEWECNRLNAAHVLSELIRAGTAAGSSKAQSSSSRAVGATGSAELVALAYRHIKSELEVSFAPLRAATAAAAAAAAAATSSPSASAHRSHSNSGGGSSSSQSRAAAAIIEAGHEARLQLLAASAVFWELAPAQTPDEIKFWDQVGLVRFGALLSRSFLFNRSL